MSGLLERAFTILTLLNDHPVGLPVGEIASRLEYPPSGAHRLLTELTRLGYVRQDRPQGDYKLTIKLAAMGLSFLSRTGITDLSQPILDDLAKKSQELVRLALFDGNDLIWVAVSQGSTAALRYDPGSEQGVVVHFASSAGGQAWLAAMEDDEARAAIERQGVVRSTEPGLKPPQKMDEVLALVHTTRTRGYSMNSDSYHPGMAAMATVIRNPSTGAAIGTVSIAGPSVRMTPAHMQSLAGDLLEAAQTLGQSILASGYLSHGPNLPVHRALKNKLSA